MAIAHGYTFHLFSVCKACQPALLTEKVRHFTILPPEAKAAEMLVLLLWVSTAAALFASLGDALLSFLLRLLAPRFVGRELSLRWSLRSGALEIRTLRVSSAVFPAFGSLVGLPLGFEGLEVARLLIFIPLWALITGRQRPIRSKVEIVGLRLVLSVDTPGRWIWSDEKNVERCRQAVKDAARARIQRVDVWTDEVIDKLREIARFRGAGTKKSESNGMGEQAHNAPSELFSNSIVDEIIDSFEFGVKSFSLLIRSEDTDAEMGIAFDCFEIGRSAGEEASRRKRVIRFEKFEIFLNANLSEGARTCHLISPLSMEILVFMPFIFQGLLMGATTGERVFELDISLTSGSKVILELRPAQIKAITEIIHVINLHDDWEAHARIEDEKSCVELSQEQSEEYILLYALQSQYYSMHGLFVRIVKNWMFKNEVTARRKRLKELEAKELASRLLYLRSHYHEWDIPESGTLSKECQKKAALRRFVSNPVDKYTREMPQDETILHWFKLIFDAAKMELLLIGDDERPLLSFFANDTALKIMCAVTPVKEQESLVVGFEIDRFGLLDKRNQPSNVFYQLIDKKHQADALIRVDLSMQSDGFTDISVSFIDFTFLLVFDPLVFVVHEFLTAIRDDEIAQLRFLSCDYADLTQSPEFREQTTPFCTENLSQNYTPLLFDGLELSCNIEMKGVEFCVLGEPSSLDSQALAFSFDLSFIVTSSSNHEAIKVELVDISLVPCTVILGPAGIDLNIRDHRTILVFEGEGVDFTFRYQLTESDPRSCSLRVSNEKSNFGHIHAAKKGELVANIGAQREFSVNMSDCELNMTTSDVRLLLRASASLAMATQEDTRAVKERNLNTETWNRIVNPSLANPAHRSAWLLSKKMDMGGRTDNISQLLTCVDDKDCAAVPINRGGIFIQTELSITLGGISISLVNEILPRDVPAIEIALMKFILRSNFSVWEDGTAVVNYFDEQYQQRSKDNCGVGNVTFDIIGNYYNAKEQQIESFLELYTGSFQLKRGSGEQLDISCSSNSNLQLNISSTLMEVFHISLANLSRVKVQDRPHISKVEGLFWFVNEAGVNMKYYVVAKKQSGNIAKEEIVASVASVAPSQAHACVLLNSSEELNEFEQWRMLEKQLRETFCCADMDGCGELVVEEVRAVIKMVFGDAYRESICSPSTFFHIAGGILNEEDLNRIADDFITLADTNHTGVVSWEQFKYAIAKSRPTVDRCITLEIDGFEPITNIPLEYINQTQVYELIPFFEEIEAVKAIDTLFKKGISLLSKGSMVSRRDLDRAYACLLRVMKMNPNYKGVNAYYDECLASYSPVLVAVSISVDDHYGMQVKVTSAECICNGTTEDIECLLQNDTITGHNSHKRNDDRHFVLCSQSSLCIPLDLVGSGSFAFRQAGKKEWSNFLPISFVEQRLSKRRISVEGVKTHGNTNSMKDASNSAEKMMDSYLWLPNPTTQYDYGSEIAYPSAELIGNQPVTVVEKVSANNPQLGTWSLIIEPQLILHNILPCGIEYAVDQLKEFACDDESGSSKFVESGESIEVFGLDMSRPAFMTIRLCASALDHHPVWSPPFLIHLNRDRETFNTGSVELRFTDGPGCMVQSKWEINSARIVKIYSPLWIQNRSELDFCFNIPEGYACSVEEHRTYFKNSRDVPIMALTPVEKSLISIRPFQETPVQFDVDLPRTKKLKKHLPEIDTLQWSGMLDISNIGTKGELRQGKGNASWILSYEVCAAPGQFSRSTILIISPRYVIVNRVPRVLQFTMLMLDEQGNSNQRTINECEHFLLAHDEAVIVYHLVGSDGHAIGLRMRELTCNHTLTTSGDWSTTIPLFNLSTKFIDPNVSNNLAEDSTVWMSGRPGVGPICSIAVRYLEEIVYAEITDISPTPPYRIENCSTEHTFCYAQLFHGSTEFIIGPLQSHSFSWDDPKSEQKLKVMSVQCNRSLEIDFSQIGEVIAFPTTDVYAGVYIDGVTRVLAIGDTKCCDGTRQRRVQIDWLSNTIIDVEIPAIQIILVDENSQEVMSFKMDNIRIKSGRASHACILSVHHIQLDGMTINDAHSVVMAPTDSGFNSDKREGWQKGDGECPVLWLTIDLSPQADITMVNAFDLKVNSLAVELDLEYIIDVGNLLFQFLPVRDNVTVTQQGIGIKSAMLVPELPAPDTAKPADSLLYIKHLQMSSFDIDLLVCSAEEDGGEGILAFFDPALGSFIETAKLHFDEIVYSNRYLYLDTLVSDVAARIVRSLLKGESDDESREI